MSRRCTAAVNAHEWTTVLIIKEPTKQKQQRGRKRRDLKDHTEQKGIGAA